MGDILNLHNEGIPRVGSDAFDLDRFMQALVNLKDGRLYNFIAVYYGPRKDSHPEDHQLIDASRYWRH
ncbi:hypothetical protein KBD71_04730 [Candidatus Woesebacteria bacterium]|nr:hypothetical protein [Candidatus Woesebacteria bacterium]